MSTVDRLRSVRAALVAGVVLRAVAWGVAAALSVAIVGVVADLRAGLSLATRYSLIAIALLSLVAVAAALIRRDRFAFSLHRVALWIEEQHPELEYRLVTAVETQVDDLVPAKSAVNWQPMAVRRASYALVRSAAAVASTFIVLLLLPRGAVARIRSPHVGDSLDRPVAGVAASRLSPLVAELTPPAYSGEKPSVIDEPANVRALVGTTIVIRGRGVAAGIRALATADTVDAQQMYDRWQATIKVGSAPMAWRLTDGAHERIIAIEPIADAPPTVTLNAPSHDSVFRTPQGRLPLSADIADDWGIASAAFELIVSSGEGESFRFKSGTIGATRPNGRRATITATLSIDSLALKPGDIVHIRAVARDANNVSGPGVGTSETRAIRIARADEYDSVSVDAAAPGDAEKSTISERMLIMLTESLQKRRPSLRRDVVVSESRSIGADQKKLRRMVGEVVFTRLGGDPSGEEHTDDDPPTRAKTMEELLARADSATNAGPGITDFEGGESPVVAVNKPLLEAYNAMWDASNELEIGEPARALPHMRRALAAIERARQAERLYLRGRPPQVVIDIAKARLQGKDKGASSKRRPLTPSDSMRQSRIDRFVGIIELAARNSAAAADSLLILRIDALVDNPPFASALAEAADAIRRNRAVDATAALARARRSLSGTPVARDSIARWGVIP